MPMPQHEKLDYVEFPARDLKATQAFFNSVFGWDFENFGPDYCAFSGQGLDGGFYRSALYSSTQNGSALLARISHHPSTAATLCRALPDFHSVRALNIVKLCLRTLRS
jgi:predicted enzyme related to lactoylglutathione lyase